MVEPLDNQTEELFTKTNRKRTVLNLDCLD